VGKIWRCRRRYPSSRPARTTDCVAGGRGKYGVRWSSSTRPGGRRRGLDAAIEGADRTSSPRGPSVFRPLGQRQTRAGLKVPRSEYVLSSQSVPPAQQSVGWTKGSRRCGVVAASFRRSFGPASTTRRPPSWLGSAEINPNGPAHGNNDERALVLDQRRLQGRQTRRDRQGVLTGAPAAAGRPEFPPPASGRLHGYPLRGTQIRALPDRGEERIPRHCHRAVILR